jgi:hypothetical protein
MIRNDKVFLFPPAPAAKQEGQKLQNLQKLYITQRGCTGTVVVVVAMFKAWFPHFKGAYSAPYVVPPSFCFFLCHFASSTDSSLVGQCSVVS